MKIEEAIETVLSLASEGMIGMDVLINDPHLGDEHKNQQEAIDTVHDFFVNNVFN